MTDISFFLSVNYSSCIAFALIKQDGFISFPMLKSILVVLVRQFLTATTPQQSLFFVYQLLLLPQLTIIVEQHLSIPTKIIYSRDKVNAFFLEADVMILNSQLPQKKLLHVTAIDNWAFYCFSIYSINSEHVI